MEKVAAVRSKTGKKERLLVMVKPVLTYSTTDGWWRGRVRESDCYDSAYSPTIMVMPNKLMRSNKHRLLTWDESEAERSDKYWRPQPLDARTKHRPKSYDMRVFMFRAPCVADLDNVTRDEVSRAKEVGWKAFSYLMWTMIGRHFLYSRPKVVEKKVEIEYYPNVHPLEVRKTLGRMPFRPRDLEPWSDPRSMLTGRKYQKRKKKDPKGMVEGSEKAGEVEDVESPEAEKNKPFKKRKMKVKKEEEEEEAGKAAGTNKPEADPNWVGRTACRRCPRVPDKPVTADMRHMTSCGFSVMTRHLLFHHKLDVEATKAVEAEGPWPKWVNDQ